MDNIDQLKKERKKLLQEVEGLLSMITVPVLVVDGRGIVVHVNNLAEKVWMKSQITLINKPLGSLMESERLLDCIRKLSPNSMSFARQRSCKR
jgi:transcriptional regulator with PAS, ATPase and Fis domain